VSLAVAAYISIGLAILCAVVIAVDVGRHPQPMRVMNVVWPVTALYLSVLALWAYFAAGRRNAMLPMHDSSGPHHGRKDATGSASAMQVATSTSHCGAGCMCADVVCETVIAATGLTLLGSVLWAEYAIDFIAAWCLGIVFQYFAIKPMRPVISVREALVAAMKADTFSIVAFQVGMYAWMALVYFKLFPHSHLTPLDPRYWFMMQIGMIAGFITAYPMNWVLIRYGMKEAMR
jgi:hypothetical protein